MPIIEVKNLKYRYPGAASLAIDDVTFSINKGEFIGIVGANGAGKSTLCQAIIGLVPQFYKGAYGGKVIVNPESGKQFEAAKSHVSTNSSYIGLIFQNPFNQLSGAKDTVYDEVAFGLQNLGVDRIEMNTRIERVLKQLDIWQYKDRNPFELSGGQMQRVAIASILVMEPEIIILDEPTSQLDPQGTEEVFKVVDYLSKTGKTIIMVEQKMEVMAHYCDRILLMDDGKVIDYDKPECIFSRDDIYEHNVEPPVYTRLCRQFELRSSNGYYSTTLEQIKQIIDELPEEDRKRLTSYNECNKGKVIEKSENNTKASNNVFEVKNLDFSYSDEVHIFNGLNLNLDLCPTAIIGQNGAGKTTLVRLMKGLLKPSGGSVTLFGEDISKKTVASLASKVGYVFQNPDDQIFKTKVFDEVMFGPLNIGMDENTAKQRALEALKLMGLEGKENENPYDLELHERKLIAIASVVAMDTDVIILDEPTIAQDYAGKCAIAAMIKKLSGEGKLVIAILHDMDFVADNFEHVCVMAHGNVLLEGSAEYVFSHDKILQEARLKKPHNIQLLEMIKSYM